MSNKIVSISIIIALLAAIVFILWPKHDVVSKNSLGDCIAESGITMYGTDTCSSCISQKELLGEYFASVNYVNCSFNREECKEKSVTKYPTWILGDKVLIGKKSIAELEEYTGCNLTNGQ
jgi:glutaredoxin